MLGYISVTRQRINAVALVLLACTLGIFVGAKSVHAQGSVSGVTVTVTPASATVAINTAATFTATVTAGTPQPDAEWSVVGDATYAWTADSPATVTPANAAETSVSATYSSAGTYPIKVSCTVSYAVKKDDGTTGTISGNDSKTVTIYVIGGPITGTSDESYFCDDSDSSSYANLMAASGQPTGTAYSWAISGSAVYINSQGHPASPTTSTATYRGVTPGSTKPGDVTATVTYTLNGVSSTSPSFPITVHVPVSFTIISKTGPTKLTPPDPDAYGFNNQSINFQVLDGLKLPMKKAYWDESWTQPQGGGQPAIVGGVALDDQGNSTDNFAIDSQPQPINPNGDKIFGPLTHVYSITNIGGTGGNVGCPIQTYTNVYYYTYGITGNGF